jgi:hypothetical protein
MREYHVRICEGLGVKFPGPTRQKATLGGSMKAAPSSRTRLALEGRSRQHQMTLAVLICDQFQSFIERPSASHCSQVRPAISK